MYTGTEIDPQYISVSNEDIERKKNNPIMDEWLNDRIIKYYLSRDSTLTIHSPTL